ncbi:hypothetical protein JNM05_04365, partial [bacterium]|nr:hypothetical protein [bacterium]
GLKLNRQSLIQNRKSSRPAWARGLKLFDIVDKFHQIMSRPAWARGLKHDMHEYHRSEGAWIET